MKARLPQGFGGGQKQMMQRVQMMQQQIQEKSDEIEAMQFTATVGGGAVEATVSGKKLVQALHIKPEVIDPEDPEMLQDLIISAVNEALRKVDDITEEEMGKITGGLPIPGLG